MESNIDNLIEKYALQNAVEYEGEADPGSVLGKLLGEHPELQSQVPQVRERVQHITQEINTLTVDEQREHMQQYDYVEDTEEDGAQLPDLQAAEEEDVVVRFAPNPNGPPTLAHSIGMVINGEYADRYDGTLILRFDDTDPRTKRPLKDAYAWYEEDYQWLGYTPDKVVYASDNLPRYYDVAGTLIDQGHAYVCKCPADVFQDYRANGKDCPHRDRSIEANKEDWEHMLNGEIEEGDAVLKIKTDMQHDNPAIRDFTAFRIIDNPDHPRTGDTHRVWPLLDFQGAVEDHDLGTTHIIRGKDLRDSAKRQQYIYMYLDWEYPHTRHWGQITFPHLEMSTSTLSTMIQDGRLDNWMDPRAPTLRSLRRRGFQPEAIQTLWLNQGLSETDTTVNMENLESINRKLIDQQANRYFFIDNPQKVRVTTLPRERLFATVPRHPEHEERSIRELDVGPGEDGNVYVYLAKSDVETGFTRLKGLCNLVLKQVDGEWIGEYAGDDHTEAVEQDAPIIHWLPVEDKELLETTVVMPDNTHRTGYTEYNITHETSGNIIQFERDGFARIETVDEDAVTAVYAHR